MKRTVLCADIGTSSFKAALIDENANVLCTQRIFYKSLNKDAWLNCFAKITKTILKTVAASQTEIEIIAISISGNGPTIVCLDKIYSWNKNSTQSAYTGESLFLPKILQAKEKIADNWEKINYIFSGPEYLVWQLTGEAVTVLPEKRYIPTYWTDTDLKTYKIPKEKLPPFVEPTHTIGCLLPKMFKKLGISTNCVSTKDVPVFCTSSDFIAGLIGTNTLYPGAAWNRTGTSEGINLCTTTPLGNPEIRCLPSLNPNYYNASIVFANSGSKLLTYKELFYKHHSFQNFINQLLSKKDADGYNLLCNMAQDVSSSIEKINSIAKANNTKTIESLCISGIQTLYADWLQIKSNLLNKPLKITNCSDVELMGNFVNAVTGLGFYSSLEEAAKDCIKTNKIILPKSY